MNEFLANPTFSTYVLYYAACLLNIVAAIWMAASVVRMRGTDPWLFRFAITLAGMAYVIITVSMFKTPEYGPHATSLVWWWAIAFLGLLVLLLPTGKVAGGLIRIGTYIGAALAYWGAYMVFTEQLDFGELATYYGFYGANIAAAIWMIVSAIINKDLLRKKRMIIMGTGVIYAGLVITALQTMQMVLESPY